MSIGVVDAARQAGGRWRWLAAGATLWLVAVGALVASGPSAVAAPVSCPSSVDDQQAAALAAKRCAGRVEVLSARSEIRQVFVNPDGSSTVEESVVPARVHRADGSWASVDPTLVASAGSWAPRASTLDVSFSNGGPGPFATYRSGGQTLTLSWPLGSLPVPTVDGSSVVYRGVLPGVDLWVTVSATSFRPVLAVADAAAGANPALRSVAYAVGGSVRGVSTADGRVRFADANDRTVAVTDAATMWDASTAAGAGSAGSAGAGSAGAGSAGAMTPGARVAAGEVVSDARRAGDFAKVARVAQATGGHDLTVRPDAAMLTSPSTRWPLFIDPGISPSQTRFAYADSCNANNDQSSARVGLDPSDGCRYRSYFTMPVSQGGLGWMGKQVLSAEFDIELDHSYSCGPTPAWVYNTSGITASPRMPWSGSGSVAMPAPGGVPASGNANEDGGCGVADQGDMLMRFSGQAFLDRVRYAATQYWPDFTIGLCACDSSGGSESVQNYWKRFYIDSRAKLVVSYDSVPGTPRNLTTAGAACGSGVGSVSPLLSAQAVDADGGDTLSATFHWQQLPSGTVNSATRTSIPANNFTAVGLGLGSGADGQTFQWQVQTTDSNGYPSPWSPWCTFTVDVAAPPIPAVGPSGSPSYQSCDPAVIASCVPAGGPGVPGSFVLGPNGASNVTSFTYGWSNPPTTRVTVAAGASATVSTTPPRFGLNTLYVLSSNGVKSSPVKAYQFLVNAPPAPLGYWPLDDINGHGFTDQIGGGTLTTTGGVTWLPDARYIGAKAASYDGTTGAAAAAVAGLDTAKSFSVGLWVRPSAVVTTRAMTALGIDSADAGGFYLGMRTDTTGAPVWSFLLKDSSASTSHSVYANSAPLTSAAAGKWAYLVGVFDAAQRTSSLYVNGSLVATSSRTAAWTAPGPLSIGRGFYGGHTADWWSGQLADVRVWNRVVTADDLTGTDADPAGGVPALPGLMAATSVGDWSFADTAGCGCRGPAADGSYFGRGMFLDPGWAGASPTSAFVVDSHDGDGALWTAGTGGYAATLDPSDGIAHPVVRTDQSLTISLWARVDAVTGAQQTVIRQGGTTPVGPYSAMKLELNGVDSKWSFSVTSPNGGGYTWTTVEAPTPVTAGQWTHLVGVFDAGSGAVRLYVNGALAASGSGATGWYSTDALILGGSGGGSNPFDGVIDQVQVWQGTLSDREVTRLYQDSA